MRDALVAALTLNIFNRHSQRVAMANIAQTINVLQALILTEPNGGRMLLTPTYHVFEMYKVHQDATLLALDLRCDDYVYQEHAMPAISASASRDHSGRLHLSLCNVNPNQAAEVSCEVRGMALNSIRGRVLTADRMQVHNTFDAPEQVRPVELPDATVQSNQLTVTLPAMSVAVLELQ
jgi:alpha-N-arabinofuranosidase